MDMDVDGQRMQADGNQYDAGDHYERVQQFHQMDPNMDPNANQDLGNQMYPQQQEQTPGEDDDEDEMDMQ